jgi:ferritin-like metal-binding protein YciE
MKDGKEALNGYISDMLSLEEHIQKALDAQLEDLKDYPAVTAELRSIRGTVESHADALRDLLDRRGGDEAGPVKRAGSKLLGWAAGAIDLVRNEGLPKNLRDDYTASSLATIGYVMLHTTARSLNEAEVGDLALRHLREYARVVMLLHNLIPGAVMEFLREEGLPVDETRLDGISRDLEEVWRETAKEVPEADEMSAAAGRV